MWFGGGVRLNTSFLIEITGPPAAGIGGRIIGMAG